MEIPVEIVARLRAARRVVVVTGAGVSAESGIPTFRDALTGLWARYDPAELATPAAFARHPSIVWGWYQWRRNAVLQAQPNAGHRAIGELAEWVPDLRVVTQNVDDLHERAGSTGVVHLHGSLLEARCHACALPYALPAGADPDAGEGRELPPPVCRVCGGLVRPAVVWFGEMLPAAELAAAQRAVEACDVLLVAGTSGLVHPAAGLPGVAASRGAYVVQVNPAASALDDVAHVNLGGRAGVVLPLLVQAVREG